MIDNQRRSYVYCYILYNKDLRVNIFFYLKSSKVIEIINIVYKPNDKFIDLKFLS